MACTTHQHGLHLARAVHQALHDGRLELVGHRLAQAQVQVAHAQEHVVQHLQATHGGLRAARAACNRQPACWPGPCCRGQRHGMAPAAGFTAALQHGSLQQAVAGPAPDRGITLFCHPVKSDSSSRVRRSASNAASGRQHSTFRLHMTCTGQRAAQLAGARCTRCGQECGRAHHACRGTRWGQAVWQVPPAARHGSCRQLPGSQSVVGPSAQTALCQASAMAPYLLLGTQHAVPRSALADAAPPVLRRISGLWAGWLDRVADCYAAYTTFPPSWGEPCTGQCTATLPMPSCRPPSRPEPHVLPVPRMQGAPCTGR